LAPVREEVDVRQNFLAAASFRDKPVIPYPVGRRAAAVAVPRGVGGGARRRWRLRNGSMAKLLQGISASDWARPGRRAPPEHEVARTGTARWQATPTGGAGLHGTRLASAQIQAHLGLIWVGRPSRLRGFQGLMACLGAHPLTMEWLGCRIRARWPRSGDHLAVLFRVLRV
jgi:hypothetical protein